MKRRLNLYSVMMLLLALAWFPGAHAGPPGVVIQVSDNDPGRWALALNNAKNMQTELGKNNVTIEIVAFGPGIDMFKKDSKVAKRLEEAKASGIALLACENTMRSRKMTKNDMHPLVDYVSSGVVEIMKKQQEGWAYLRP